jgi:hypothetical protein
VKGGGIEGESGTGLRLLDSGVVGRSGMENWASGALVVLIREVASSVLRASCVEVAADALLLRFLVAVAGFFVSLLATLFEASVSVLIGSVFEILRAERRRDMVTCLYVVTEIGRNAGCFSQWQEA